MPTSPGALGTDSGFVGTAFGAPAPGISAGAVNVNELTIEVIRSSINARRSRSVSARIYHASVPSWISATLVNVSYFWPSTVSVHRYSTLYDLSPESSTD